MLFTIVIPVYNVEPYLRDCLNSVLSQTYGDWEAICVDDGSTDDSGAILDSYAAMDSRIVVIHQGNSGVSAARNVALDNAHGEWIGFLDGDDVWSQNLLKVCMEVIVAHKDADIIAFNVCRFLQNSDLPFYGVDSFECPTPFFFDSRRVLDAGSAINNFSGKLYCKKVINDVRFKPYITGEDKLFLLEAMLVSRGTVLIDKQLYGYRVRSGSATQSNISLRKVMDSMHYTYDELCLLARTKKHVPYWYVKLKLNWLVEVSMFLISKLDKRDQSIAYSERESLLRSLPTGLPLSVFQRMRLLCFFVFPFKCIAQVLFALPFTIKRQLSDN